MEEKKSKPKKKQVRPKNPVTPANPNGAGRKPAWTIEREEKVMAALMRGHSRRAAATYAGISQDTFERWLKIGHGSPEEVQYMPGRSEMDLPDFAARVLECEFVPEDMSVECVTTHIGNGNLRAAVFFLQTRRPKEWGRQDREALPLEHLDDDALVRETLRNTPGGL